jgi:hypothetical protein
MNAPVKYVGVPDGPKIFVPELGCEVTTFKEPAGGKRDSLKWHIPLEMRGDYRPQDLANYDPNKNYRTDVLGKVLCYAFNQSGERCSKRAVNRYPRCDIHSGRLHPLDKLVRDDEKAESNAQAESLSRYRQFMAGQLTVDDLEDEELATCGFRSKNGAIFKPKTVPRELAQAFTRAIYERAQSELRSLTVEAAQTMGEIMKNKSVEPDIRLKAALSIIERNLGKTPQVLAITDAKAYEEVFDGILPVTREQSRAAREGTIDAEIIDIEQPVFPEGNAATHEEDENRSGTTEFGSTVTSPQVEHSGLDTESGKEDRMGDSRTIGSSESIRPVIDETPKDARLFERNEAILAQTLEIKHREYDLTDHTAEIKKATKTRYAKRAAPDDIPITITQTAIENGLMHVDMDIPQPKKNTQPSKSKVAQRKSYTLGDFS